MYAEQNTQITSDEMHMEYDHKTTARIEENELTWVVEDTLGIVDLKENHEAQKANDVAS